MTDLIQRMHKTLSDGPPQKIWRKKAAIDDVCKVVAWVSKGTWNGALGYGKTEITKASKNNYMCVF